MYPAYRKKNDKVNSYAERLQGCFQFSMNGKAPEADGPVIAALPAYSYWLATGAPTGQELPGRAYPEVPQPEGGYDLAKGEQVYDAQCAVCHGPNGEGQKSGDLYVFPPLWFFAATKDVLNLPTALAKRALFRNFHINIDSPKYTFNTTCMMR